MKDKQPRRRQLLIEARPDLPVWGALPLDCRDEVLGLLVRMLQAHAASEVATGEEADDD